MKSKNYSHFSLQLSLVCAIFAIMVGALSSVSKAFSSDDRGILASNVDFVAELQDNTNVYDENLVSLGRDISRVSDQFLPTNMGQSLYLKMHIVHTLHPNTMQ